MRTTEQQLEWRRNQVLDLTSIGHNQSEIARILKVHKSVISKDCLILGNQARENLQTHLHDRLPAEFEYCMNGINQILKKSWEIANRGQSVYDTSNSDSERTLETTAVDDRTRLQALSLANDCYKYKMDLVTNGVVITDAIKFVQQKKVELNQMNADKVISSEEQESMRTKEEEKEEILNSDNPDSENTKNKVF